MNKRQFLASSLTAAVGAASTAASGATPNATSRMVKMVFILHRRPGMDVDDFSRYWRDKHAPIGSALPGLRKYVQNHVGATLDGSPLPYDGFSELWFDDMASLQRALTSPEGQAAVADSANFLDVKRIQTFIVEEVTVKSD
jgi:uncharacterized protein (TIGR02118 family)